MRDIVSLLKEEGLKDEQITWGKDNQFEDETGFFSWHMEHGWPYMTHFYVDVEKRSMSNAMRLYRKFRDMIIKQGYDHFIAESPPGKEVFGKFIKACMGCTAPYATVNGSDYYLIKVRNRNENLH